MSDEQQIDPKFPETTPGACEPRKARETLVHCHKCASANAPDSRYCKKCGAILAQSHACPSCGAVNDSDARFCNKCGARL